MKKFLLLSLILSFALPCYAVNCEKKPCHKKCIDSQPARVKLNCYCQNRKNIYYNYGWGQRTGVPAYEEACDGSIENYRIRYCQAKQEYDAAQMRGAHFSSRIYLPEYDANCDGSYEQFMQLRQQVLDQQKAELQIKQLNQPQVIYHDVNVNGTMKHNINITPLTPRFRPIYGY